MSEFLQIFRARVPEESVAALLDIRPEAIAEASKAGSRTFAAFGADFDDRVPWLGSGRGSVF